MERDLLQDMVKERDQKIAELHKAKVAQDKKLASAKRELDKRRSQQKEQMELNGTEISELKQQRHGVERQMATLEREMKQSGALHMYADLVKSSNPNHVDSSYVVRMQAQLCKAMHSMGMLENQMVLVKTNCNDDIQSLKDEITGIIDEKCKMEVEVMNELVLIDNEKRDTEEKLSSLLHAKEENLVELQKEVDKDEYGSDDEWGSSRRKDSNAADELDRATKINDLVCGLELLKKEKAMTETALQKALKLRTDKIRNFEEKITQQAKQYEQMKSDMENGAGKGGSVGTVTECSSQSRV